MIAIGFSIKIVDSANIFIIFDRTIDLKTLITLHCYRPL